MKGTATQAGVKKSTSIMGRWNREREKDDKWIEVKR